MPVNIGEMITEATVEPDAQSAPESGGTERGQAVSTIDKPARSMRDLRRVAAEGYDD